MGSRNAGKGGAKGKGKTRSLRRWTQSSPKRREARISRTPFNPVAKHAGINKAVTHPDQSKTIPRFRKHKLHEAMFDDQ